jgi:WD40-like Beta Propeller Repeat
MKCPLLATATTLLFAICVFPCNAQNNLAVVSEWTADAVESEVLPAISPDGLHVAYLQLVPGDIRSYKLFNKNIATGDDKLILDSANGQRITGPVAFSPDGTRLIFTGWGPSAFNGINLNSAVYAVQTDGANLIQIAPGDPKTATYCTPNVSARSGPLTAGSECGVSDPVYSPDGTKVMLRVVTNPGVRNQDGGLNAAANSAVIGVLPATAKQEEPEKLIDGGLFPFWSSDSSSIYYEKPRDDDSLLYRFNLQTKQTTATNVSAKGMLLKVPGTDAILVHKGNSVNVVALQSGASTSVNAALISTVGNVPLSDAEGRGLDKIEPSLDGSRLLVVYSGAVGGGQHPPDYYRQHLEVVTVQ